MKTLMLSITTGAALILSGCASNTSPVAAAPGNRITATDAAVVLGGTAAGAVAGKALGGDKGEIIGAAVGLVGGALTSNKLSSSRNQELAEAREAGAREARVAMVDKLWEEQSRQKSQKDSSAATPAQQEVQYPSGTVEGVQFGPRTATKLGIEEPKR